MISTRLRRGGRTDGRKTHLGVRLVGDKNGVHEHVLGQVPLCLQRAQERVVVPAGEDGRSGDIVRLVSGLTSSSRHVVDCLKASEAVQQRAARAGRALREVEAVPGFLSAGSAAEKICQDRPLGCSKHATR